MKLKTVVALSFCSLTLTACFDRVPPKLQEMMKSNETVKTYEAFEEINSVTPLPGKFQLSLGAIAKMLITGKQKLPFAIVPAGQYNNEEQAILRFFNHPGLQKSLRLLSYARQLKQGHPYRINPFVSFFTLRPENKMFSDMKVGPAALVAPVLEQKGPYQGSFAWKDYAGNNFDFAVSISPKSLPFSGSMLLFDHELFTMSDLISHPEQNILQDVIVHEFTHIWNNELISAQAQMDSSVDAKKSENGHDTMIVSNPHLAFSEGLAESFEAIYGTPSSQMTNMSRAERRQFFGSLSTRALDELEFLINRQIYIRDNAYLYNLYDFKNCTLRLVQTINSGEHGSESGSRLSKDQIFERMLKGEEFTAEAIWAALNGKEINWARFRDRFYGSEKRVSPLTLREYCQVDSPGRIESKEGFIASMLYGLLASGALSGDELERPTRTRETASVSDKNLRLKTFRNFVEKTLQPSDSARPYLDSASQRKVAAESPADSNRMVALTRNFLLGFRNLAQGIISADATTLGELMSWYFSPESLFNRDEQLRLAFQFMSWSQGSFYRAANSADTQFQSFFKDSKTIRANLDAIHAQLDGMYQLKELSRVAGRLGEVPGIYVEYESKFQPRQSGETEAPKMRINLNLAHHIDLIDIFGKNNKAITALATRLDRGEYFQNEAEVLDFARSIDADASLRPLLESAKASIQANEKIREQFGIKEFERTSTLGL